MDRYRGERTRVDVANNLVSHDMRARDGAQALESGNVADVTADFFVDAAVSDLHLVTGALPAIDQGVSLAPELSPLDIDGQTRGSPTDVGADEL